MVKRNFNQKGVTIVELLVSMSIFLIVITLSVGGFLSLLRLQTQSEAMTSVQQNARIAIEQVSRWARGIEGIKIEDTASSNFDKLILTTDGGTRTYTYQVNPSGQLQIEDSKNAGAPALTLTSDEVRVEKFILVRKEGIPPSLDIEIEVSSTTAASYAENKINLKTNVLLSGVK